MGVAAAGGDHLARLVDEGAGRVRPAQRPAQDGALGVGGPLPRQGQQHCALALADVVAGGLARQLRVAEDAEVVVAELERHAPRSENALDGRDEGVVRAPADRAQRRRVDDRVARRLAHDHLHGRLGVHGPGIAGVQGGLLGRDVEELPQGDLGVHAAVARPQPRRVPGGEAAGLVGHRGLGPREEQIPDQDRPRLAEAVRIAPPRPVAVEGRQGDVRRRAPAPGPGVVDDVVVGQGARLVELEGGGQRGDGRLVERAAAGQAVADVGQDPPEPLAALGAGLRQGGEGGAALGGGQVPRHGADGGLGGRVDGGAQWDHAVSQVGHGRSVSQGSGSGATLRVFGPCGMRWPGPDPPGETPGGQL